MKKLVLDTETTTKNKGNPFTRSNKLMCVGTYDGSDFKYYDIEHSGLPYGQSLCDLKKEINNVDLLIGFNLKFDLHWTRRYINLGFNRVWDCQLAAFILANQTTPYPSLESELAKQSLVPKLSEVQEYWDKGIDTDLIPSDILRAYNEQDCKSTWELYQIQDKLLKGNQRKLFQLHCADLLVLQEMEFNGLVFNAKQSRVEGEKIQIQLKECTDKLNEIVGSNDINWNSPAHISAILYGGQINFSGRELVHKPRKDGTVRTYERHCLLPRLFESLVKPIEGTETTHGWSVSEDTLRSVSATGKARKIVDLILEASKLDKLLGTYYNVLPELIEKMDWPENTLHGQINQCVARTGRTSSSQPNTQNFTSELKPLFYSRFDDSPSDN